MSENFLEKMAVSSRARVQQARAQWPDSELREHALATPLPPRLRLSPQGFDLIAEVKLRSPAMGQLRGQDENVGARVADYASAGAAAVSVLTEPSRFDGSLEHLQLAVRALGARAPAMRKDFIVDCYQLYEARLAGAGGVLTILRMLPQAENAALIECATELGLFVLIEAFDEAELELAGELVRTHGAAARMAHAPLLVGVNCRDLRTLQVVPDQLEKMAPRLPAGAPHVAESGVETAEQAARLAAVGYDLALVGGALMRSANPLALVRSMLAAGRTA